MTIFQSLILGVIQGLTEFLPVSSSGHLVLFESWFGISQSGILFEIVLHVATLGAVFVFFFSALRKLTLSKVALLLLGTVPAGIVGVLFKSQIEALFNSVVLVALALLITATINLGIVYYLRKERSEPVGWKTALFIGSLQAISIIPGISRSGSTIFAGLKSGLSRQQAFEFSFLLSIPAIGGAMLLQFIDVMQAGFSLPPIAPLVAGFIAAFIAGLASLKLLKKLLVSNYFSLFGWYTASLAIGVLFFVFVR